MAITTTSRLGLTRYGAGGDAFPGFRAAYTGLVDALETKATKFVVGDLEDRPAAGPSNIGTIYAAGRALSFSTLNADADPVWVDFSSDYVDLSAYINPAAGPVTDPDAASVAASGLALQQAIDDSVGLGVPLWIPPGSYTLSGQIDISSGVAMVAPGAEHSRFYWWGGADESALVCSGGIGPRLDGFLLWGMSTDDDPVHNTRSLIWLRNPVGGCQVERVAMTNSPDNFGHGDLVHIDSSNSAYLTNQLAGRPAPGRSTLNMTIVESARYRFRDCSLASSNVQINVVAAPAAVPLGGATVELEGTIGEGGRTGVKLGTVSLLGLHVDHCHFDSLSSNWLDTISNSPVFVNDSEFGDGINRIAKVSTATSVKLAFTRTLLAVNQHELVLWDGVHGKLTFDECRTPDYDTYVTFANCGAKTVSFLTRNSSGWRSVAVGAGSPLAVLASGSVVHQHHENWTEMSGLTPQRTMSRGRILGHAQITADATAGATGYADAAGVTVDVIVPVGHRVRVTAFAYQVVQVGSGISQLQIWQDGSQIAASLAGAAAGVAPAYASSVSTPSAGAHTYKMRTYTSATTAQVAATATAPAYILVEDLDA